MSNSQSIGRIGELSVELELTSRNWLVGNFNSNIKNAAVYDLFAVKKNNKKLIRVKSYSLFPQDKGTIQYTARKTGEIFLDLLKNNKDDFVILCGIKDQKVFEFFIIPTLEVDKVLKKSNEIYHGGLKKMDLIGKLHHIGQSLFKIAKIIIGLVGEESGQNI